MTTEKKYKILMVVGGLATKENPSFQPFVSSQIESIKNLGHKIEIFNIDGIHNRWNYITKTKKLKKLAKQFNPDIVHSHYSFCGITSLVTLPAKQIISFMGEDIIGTLQPNGKIKLKDRIIRYFGKIPIPFTSAIIVKTEQMAKLFNNRENLFIIPNGVSFEKFKPINKTEARKMLGLDLNKKIILFPGNVKDPNKNYSLAKNAIDYLNTNLTSGVELVSFRTRPPEELALYYNASDALLFTSFVEGSPNVVKESLACNLPIITVPVGDTNQLLKGVKNTYICSYNSIEIANAIMKVILSGERTNGRNCIEHLELMSIAKKIEHVYSTVIK